MKKYRPALTESSEGVSPVNIETEKTLKKYCTAVSAGLVCGRRRRKEIIGALRTDIRDYIGERESVSEAELADVFGTPEQIAAGFAADTDAAELKRRLGIKRAVVIALIVIVCVYAVFAAVSLIDVHTEAHGYFEEGLLLIGNRLRAVMIL